MHGKRGVHLLHMRDHSNGSFCIPAQFGRNERPLRNIVSLGSQEELQLKDQVSALPALHLLESKVHAPESPSCAQEVTVEQFEITLCASKGVAVVEDISFRDQKITELAPTMTIEKDGVQYVSVICHSPRAALSMGFYPHTFPNAPPNRSGIGCLLR